MRGAVCSPNIMISSRDGFFAAPQFLTPSAEAPEPVEAPAPAPAPAPTPEPTVDAPAPEPADGVDPDEGTSEDTAGGAGNTDTGVDVPSHACAVPGGNVVAAAAAGMVALMVAVA